MTPLQPDEFAALMEGFAPFESHPAMAVAVSGGADSLALCFLMKMWVQERQGRLLALTVDHGLRPESTEEACQVQKQLVQQGIESIILTWTGKKPTSRIQAAAREARYHLLSQACRDAGILHLATAHHADDQVETIFMRQSKDSGEDGLAGMSARRTMTHGRLIRPLLGIARARLQATCEALGQPWVNDPSNANLRFTRVQVRHALHDKDPQPYLEKAYQHAGERQKREQEMAQLFARGAAIFPEGWMTLRWDVLTPETLRQALAVIGGNMFPPRREAAEDGLKMLQENHHPLTLGGCYVMPRQHQVVICREPAACQGLLSLSSDLTLWDRRFQLSISHPLPFPLHVGAVGQEGWLHVKKTLASDHPAWDWPAVVRQTLPGVWRDSELIYVPHLAWGNARLPVNVSFCPPRPLAGSLFTPIYQMPSRVNFAPNKEI